jgi:hypothetical protein
MTFTDQTTGVQLYAVDALSATDACAGGETHHGQPTFDHWNGSAWTPVKGAPVPNATDATISAIKVLPAGVWAVGLWNSNYLQGGSFIEHSVDGATFTLQRMPAYVDLNAIDGSSATNLWAAGSDSKNFQPVIAHWDGTAWKKSYTLAVSGGQFLSIAYLASNDIWAIGSTYTGNPGTAHPLAVHWDGAAWKRVSFPGGGPNSVETSVAGTSATNVWTAGWISQDLETCIACHGLVDTLTGGRWQVANPPTAPIHRELNGTGPANVWAVGSRLSVNYRDSHNLLDHWNGSSWTSFGGPNAGTWDQLDAITAVPGEANSFWAVGMTAAGSAILRCC